MAKFFKNYNQINLKIHEEITKNLSEEELFELNIEPKYLGMSHTKACDFCDNPENKNTLVDELVIMFGYQVCQSCKCKKISETFKRKWLIDNNILSCDYFIENLNEDHILKRDEYYKIQRTNGIFDNDWMFDSFDLIKLVKRDDGSEDLVIPFYKSNPEIRSLHKTIYLSELCRFNNLSEVEMIDNFKSAIEKLKIS